MKNLILIFILLLTSVARADCVSLYTKKIEATEAKIQEFKTGLITTGLSAGALLVALLATGTLSVGAVVGMPAGIISVGSYLGYLEVVKKQHQDALILIKQAERSDGKLLKKTQEKVNRRNEREFNLSEFAELITEANQNNEFCQENIDTGKVKLLTYHKVLKAISAQPLI